MFDVLFCLCYPMILNDVLYDMVFMTNDAVVFNLYNGDIEELEFGTLLECIVKECIKLLSQSLKADPVLCGHKDDTYIYTERINLYV